MWMKMDVHRVAVVDVCVCSCGTSPVRLLPIPSPCDLDAPLGPPYGRGCVRERGESVCALVYALCAWRCSTWGTFYER